MRYVLFLISCLSIISCKSSKLASSDFVFDESKEKFGNLTFYESSMQDVKSTYGTFCKKRKNYTERYLRGRFGRITYSDYSYSLIYNHLGLEFEFYKGVYHALWFPSTMYEYPLLGNVYFTENYPYEVNNVKIEKTTFEEIEKLQSKDSLKYFIEDVPKKTSKSEYNEFRLLYGNKFITYYSKPLLKKEYIEYEKLWTKGYDFTDDELEQLEDLKKLLITKIHIRRFG